jgi:ribosomal protein S18 acetylase RimI-like enzyme
MSSHVELLATAFDADPVSALLFPGRRPMALREWFDAVTEVLDGCQYAQIVAGPRSAVVWTTQTCPSCFDRLQDRLLEVVARHSGPEATELLGRLADASPHLPEPRWELLWLAVAPQARGAGLATALVRRVSENAADAGAAVYVETANPAAVRLYLRAGFRLVGAEVLSEAPAVHYSRLLRPPAPLLPSAPVPDAQEDEGG